MIVEAYFMESGKVKVLLWSPGGRVMREEVVDAFIYDYLWQREPAGARKWFRIRAAVLKELAPQEAAEYINAYAEEDAREFLEAFKDKGKILVMVTD